MNTPEKHQQTRWYTWGIQSPHTSTATWGGGGVLGKLRSELRKES